MNKTALSLAVITALGIASETQAVTLTFGNSTTDGVQGVDFNFACNTSNFTAGTEVRFCDPAGTLGGGLPTHKDTKSGGEAWFFNNEGQMTGVSDTAITPGLEIEGSFIPYYIDQGYVEPSADRNGGPGLDQGGLLFNYSFGFLAPYIGAEATTTGSPHPNDIAWDVAQYTATSATTFELFFPVLEMQWIGTHFTLGSASGGVTFYGTTDGTNFSMWAEEFIDSAEDEGFCCFPGWSVQWYYTGTISDVPLPASVWLFGSGLIALFSFHRRR